VLFDLVGTACRFGCTTPVTTPESVAQTSGSGDSIMWPLFLLALFAVVSWKLWKYARRNFVKLPKDWETQFWLDFDNWRGDPLNR
jgi:predicted permease